MTINAIIKKTIRGLMVLSLAASLPVFIEASISVSPTLFELKIPRGKTFTESIRVANVGTGAVGVKVYLSDFALKEDGNVEFFDAGDQAHSLSRYIRLNPTSFQLEPGEEKWVRFTVTMPEDLTGERQGILFFHTQPRGIKSPVGRQVLVAARVGAAVYAASKQTVNYSSEISALYVKQAPGSASLDYALVYHNDGNIHVRPRGELRILDPAGKPWLTAMVNEKNSSILRESYRIFTGTLTGKARPAGGIHKILAEVDYGKAILEVEKSVYLLNSGGIKQFEAAYNQGTAVFSAALEGIEPARAGAAKRFTLRTVDGRLLAEIPGKNAGKPVKDKPLIVNGQWQGKLEPGTYFAEFLVYLDQRKPITSFCRITNPADGK